MMQMREVRPRVICLKNRDAYHINYLLCLFFPVPAPVYVTSLQGLTFQTI